MGDKSKEHVRPVLTIFSMFFNDVHKCTLHVFVVIAYVITFIV